MTTVKYFVLAVPVPDGDTRTPDEIAHGMLMQLGFPTIAPFDPEDEDEPEVDSTPPPPRPATFGAFRPRISELADEVARKASDLARARQQLDAARRGEDPELEVPEYGRAAS